MKNDLLLDSHILLWSLTNDRHLSKAAEHLILTTPHIYVSAASLFELRVKAARNKVTLPDNIEQLIYAQNFTILDLSAAQLHDYRTFNTPNPDPFDNALLSVAEAQRLRFLTVDSAIIPLQKTYPWIINGG